MAVRVSTEPATQAQIEISFEGHRATRSGCWMLGVGGWLLAVARKLETWEWFRNSKTKRTGRTSDAPQGVQGAQGAQGAQGGQALPLPTVG